MQHSLTEKGGDLVVSLQGDVDLDSSPAVRELLLRCVGRGATVFVDLSNVSYIDSSGVASFVEAFQIARRNGTAFALVSVSPAARRVLELARLDKVFTIHESLPGGSDDGA
ncbi:MAG: STAS domain-containing protein [Deltaproteobacteria bacterium]|nr:MAG: STAS domain-containing protein [Deltaproteobacteria bacterium]